MAHYHIETEIAKKLARPTDTTWKPYVKLQWGSGDNLHYYMSDGAHISYAGKSITYAELNRKPIPEEQLGIYVDAIKSYHKRS